jgi:hypothetical protein
MLSDDAVAAAPSAGRHDWVSAGTPEHWLRQLDRDSYGLLHWLAQARTRRLGLYYERCGSLPWSMRRASN